MENKSTLKFRLRIIIFFLFICIIVMIATVYILENESKNENQIASNTTNNILENTVKLNNEVDDDEKGNEKDTEKGNIKIRYAYAYNIETADSLNEMEEDGYIDILEIYPTGAELEKLNTLFKDISLEKADLSRYAGTNFLPAVTGMYEVTIDSEHKLLLDYDAEWAYYTKNEEDSYLIDSPTDFVNEVQKIVSEKLEKTLKKYTAEEIVIINEETTDEIYVKDEEHIKMLTENLKFVKVNIDKDDMKDEKHTYTVNLNNGIIIDVYASSVIGYVYDEEECYVAFMNDYGDIVEKIFENYISGREDTLNSNKIVAKYLGNEYTIDNEDEVKKINNLLKICSYKQHDWLEDFGEDDYGDEDIVIDLGKSKLIIPGNKTIGNRYYIDENGKNYLISDLSEIENYFKDLVHYE